MANAKQRKSEALELAPGSKVVGQTAARQTGLSLLKGRNGSTVDDLANAKQRKSEALELMPGSKVV